MLTRVLAHLEIIRPHNMLAAALGVAAGYYVAGGSDARAVLPVAMLAALATGAGNVINDIFDFEIDRVNKPRRPLPSGRMSRRSAVVWYALLSAVTVAGGVMLGNLRLTGIVLLWQVFLFLYASVFKRHWVGGNLTVAAVSASAFLAGAVAAGDARAAMVPMAIAFAFVVCRELIKGGEDLEGDRAAGVRTLAVVAGRTRAARVAGGAMLALAALIPAPAVAGLYGIRYFVIMEVLVVPVLVVGAVTAARAPERAVFAKISRALKLAMFAGIAAIAAGV
jgi:geranylgeranylglycerol-phosphate geranylgeranyltransferase